jgi:hypothetical protein
MVLVMEKWKRKIFFWLLVVVFFVAAPSIILYARGFRFDLGKGIFVHSGTITIKSNPQSFDVSLNGKVNDSKDLNRINSSYNFNGLLPGPYEIKIYAADFQAWSKKTDVHSGLSSEFWNVILVRNNYEKLRYEETLKLDKFFMSPKNKFIAFSVSSDEDLKVKLLNIENEKVEKQFSLPGWKMISDAEKENMEWSPEEDYLSVPVEKEIAETKEETAKNSSKLQKEPAILKTIRSYFIVNPLDNSFVNLNEFIGNENIKNVRWDPKEKGYLFFLSDKKLFRASIETANNIKLIAEDVSSYDLSKDAVFYVKQPNNLVYKSDLSGSNDPRQITNSFPEPDREISRLIIYDDSRMGFIDSEKKMFIYNQADFDTYFKNIGSSIEGLHFSNDGKKILFWSENEIFVYFTRNWDVQPQRKEDELQTITRYSEPIRNVQWHKDYEHVIFSTGRWTKIIELDPRDHRNCMDLTSTTLETPFMRYNNYLERLYFTELGENNETFLNSIEFPEPIPFLGIGG